MNLIEKLGGYEKAKRELKLKEENSMFQCCTAIDSRMIRDALLEHRRANNIFEVGDSVLFKDAWLWLTVFVIKEVTTNANSETAYLVSKKIAPTADKIRHATDEEIKAGYRL